MMMPTTNGHPAEAPRIGTASAETCAGCAALTERVERIESALRAAEEQGRAAMAKMPRAMRKMLGIPDLNDDGGG